MASYHQLNPLIRIKETTLLQPQDWQQLIAADTAQQAMAILQQTTYQRYIGTDFLENFERYLDQELLVTIQELAENCPDPDVLRLAMLPYTFHNLKVLTKEDVTGRDYHHLLIEDGFHTMEELKSAIQTGGSEHLSPKIIETIQAVREYLEGSAVLQGIDIIYDRRLLHEQRRLAEKINIPPLTQAVITAIDLTNITIAARCLLQKRSRNFMAAVLVSVGSIPKEDYLAFADTSFADFIAFLKESDYQEALLPLLQEHTIDFAALAVLKDDLFTQQFMGTDALGLMPLLAFLNAKLLEIQNLRLLLVGKRSGFTEEELRERMREYGS
ncbi:V-type ATPase subunit [Enterococcus sp.]|uniref:V-type ATPase subunit n=1 Tax=Enterococcus sp. TaxID=35783 RepID=UPI0025BCBEAC|nr:V-type ATPase subunit [Enterococcus sp.]